MFRCDLMLTPPALAHGYLATKKAWILLEEYPKDEVWGDFFKWLSLFFRVFPDFKSTKFRWGKHFACYELKIKWTRSTTWVLHYIHWNKVDSLALAWFIACSRRFLLFSVANQKEDCSASHGIHLKIRGRWPSAETISHGQVVMMDEQDSVHRTGLQHTSTL